MSWRDQLQQGSIDGVPFFTHQAPADLGLRTVVHEFPGRNDPEIEELGQGAARFPLDIFVIGDDYMSARNAVEAVLLKGGSHRLVHPYRGLMNVNVEGRFQVFETADKGGYASFHVTFVRSSTKIYPTASIDTAGTSKSAASAGIAQAQTQFAKKFSLAAAPGFVVQAAIAQLGTITTVLNSAANSITTLASPEAALVAGIKQFSSGLSSLILSPGELAQSIVTMIGQLQTAATQPLAAFQALQMLFGFSPAPPGPTSTPSRAQQESNRAEISRIVSRVAVLSAASSTADIDYASYDDAVTARNTLLEQFDALATDIDDADMFNAWLTAQSAMSDDLTTRGLQLPRLKFITLSEATPCVVLAWRLYGDATQAQSIIDRNKLSDPLFVPAGVPIEVVV